MISVDLSFTELRDEGLRLLLPFLGALPKLTTLALNGNRLTLGILKDLTEALKDSKFSCLAWIDLGNNVDIFTMPQVKQQNLKINHSPFYCNNYTVINASFWVKHSCTARLGAFFIRCTTWIIQVGLP